MCAAGSPRYCWWQVRASRWRQARPDAVKTRNNLCAGPKGERTRAARVELGLFERREVPSTRGLERMANVVRVADARQSNRSAQ